MFMFEFPPIDDISVISSFFVYLNVFNRGNYCIIIIHFILFILIWENNVFEIRGWLNILHLKFINISIFMIKIFIWLVHLIDHYWKFLVVFENILKKIKIKYMVKFSKYFICQQKKKIPGKIIDITKIRRPHTKNNLIN